MRCILANKEGQSIVWHFKFKKRCLVPCKKNLTYFSLKKPCFIIIETGLMAIPLLFYHSFIWLGKEKAASLSALSASPDVAIRWKSHCCLNRWNHSFLTSKHFSLVPSHFSFKNHTMSIVNHHRILSASLFRLNK